MFAIISEDKLLTLTKEIQNIFRRSIYLFYMSFLKLYWAKIKPLTGR